MPYVTEEIWAQLGGDGGLLLTAPWPEFALDLNNQSRRSAADMEWVIAAISGIRAVRNELNVPPGARLPLLVKESDPVEAERLEHHGGHILRLARIESIKFADAVPNGAVSLGVGNTTLILPLGDVVDLGQEKARLGKEIGRLDADLAKFAAKLGNPGFLSKAKPEVIEEQREREADTRRDRDRLKAAYDRLEGV
jgi:valyl-tRNA synthetase